ncbi:MAG TPA: AAA family ATPase, partial [Acidimicrobiales bacterium]
MLVGRRSELDLLHATLDDGERGVGAVVLLDGEAGIGKTTLLDSVAAQAMERGWHVRRAAADELEGARPFALIGELFPEVVAALAPLRVGTRVSALDSTPPTRLVAIDEVVAVAERLRLAAPLMVVADDLQWADSESLPVLTALIRRARATGVLMVLARRAGVVRGELARVESAVAAASGSRWALGPLGDDDVTRLVAGMLDAEPDARVLERVHAAGGNPFLVGEVVAVMRGGGQAEVDGDDLPSSARAAVLQHVRLADPVALDLLRQAAVLGQSFRVAELAALADKPRATVARALLRVIDAGVVIDDGDQLRFRHDLVRQALESELPPSVRRTLHREAANVLQAMGAPALRLAPHLLRGAEPGDAEAVRWFVDAAREAADNAPGAAAELLQHARGLCPPGGPVAAELALGRARLLVWAGRAADADAAAAELTAQGGLSADLVHELTGIRSRALFLLGRPHEAVQLVADALAPSGASPQEVALGLAEVALARLFAADLAGASSFASRAIERDTAGPAAVTVARSVLAWTAALRGDMADALAQADAAVQGAQNDPTGTGLRYHPRLFEATVLDARGDSPGARLSLRQGRHSISRYGVAWARPLYDWSECVTAFRAGEWDDALALGEAGLVGAQEAGIRLGALWPHAVAAIVAVRRGQGDLAAAALARADADAAAAAGPMLGREWQAFAHALAAEDRGDRATAAMILGAVWDLADGAGAIATRALVGVDLVRL